MQVEAKVSSESDDDFCESCFRFGEKVSVTSLCNHVQKCSKM